MRISRPCYDKPHRCPGWAGGGWKSARRDRCDGGYVTTKKLDISWWLDGGAKTCTCGEAIVASNPEFGFNTGWVDASGSGWCRSDGGAVRHGHRPQLEYTHVGTDKWRFGHCAGSRDGQHGDRTPGKGCGTVTIPWALRRLDPRWWLIYRYRLENWLRYDKGWIK